MFRPIKIVKMCDEIFDCLPLVSTAKNAGIFLYKLSHKVNKSANPVNTSWTDDIKIHVLSKDDFIAGISMIPIVGNLTALAYHLRNALAKARGMFILGGPIGYLGEATRAFSWGLKKHSHEVVALYLARNPNRPEEKLCKALRFAVSAGKEDIVKLILESRAAWSSNSIEEVLKSTGDAKIAKIILQEYSHILTGKQVGSILRYLAGNFLRNNYSLIELLISTYPDIDINEIGRTLESAAGSKSAFDTVSLLLRRFPIDESYVAKALEKASKEGFGGVIEALLENSPNLIPTHIGGLLEHAASRGDEGILNWLLNTYADNVSSTAIGKALASATKCRYFGEDDKHLLIIKTLINKYPNLPGKDLEPAVQKTALLNAELFKFYLNSFSQLQPEHLQNILNEAFYFYWRPEIVQLIKEKFPTMVAVDPLDKYN